MGRLCFTPVDNSVSSDARCSTTMCPQHDARREKLCTARACSTLNPQTFIFLKQSHIGSHAVWSAKDLCVKEKKTLRPLEFDFTCRESVYTQMHRLFIIWKCVYMCGSDSWPWGIWPLALRVIQACTWTVWYAQGHISGFCPHLWLPVSPGLPHESQQQAAVTSFPCENSLGLPKKPWLFSTKLPSPPTCCPKGIVTLNYKAPLIRCR